MKVNDSPQISIVCPNILESRIDVQPYLPRFLESEEVLVSHNNTEMLNNLIRSQKDLTGGATPLGANYLNNGIRFIRTQDITPNWIDLSNIVYISKDDHAKLRRSELQENDVLLTITGALYGQSAVVRKSCLPANISQHSVRIHFVDDMDCYFISTFLNCSYGQDQIKKHQVGATRSAIDYDGIKNIRIPIPSKKVQKYISSKVRLAEKCREEAKIHTDSVRKFFNNFFKLEQFKENNEKSYVVKPNKLDSNWLNAGFYRKRYFDLIDHLNRIGLKLAPLSHFSLCDRKKIKPKKGKIKYFEIKDIDITSGRIINVTEYEARNAPNNAQRLAKPLDIIISTRRPTRGAVAIIPPDLDGAFYSVFLAHFVAKEGNSPYFIKEYLRTYPGKMFMEQRCTETTYPVISEDDLETVPVPVVTSDCQFEIEKNLKISEMLEQKSFKLISKAKTDVENLIEGKLDTEAIISGKIKTPTWEDIEKELEAELN